MARGLILLAALLAGCSTIDKYVVGFPALEPRVHYVKAEEIAPICFPGVSVWKLLIIGTPIACAKVDLFAQTCDVFVVDDVALSHELEHCRGGDHDDRLQDLYDRWVSLGKPTSGK